MLYTPPQPFEEIDHTADLGVRVRGQSAEEVVARLVLAFAHIVTGGGAVQSSQELIVTVEAADGVSMAIDVLRELLFRFDCDGVVPAACEVLCFDEQQGARVRVTLGEHDPQAHEEGVELKAVTFHEAELAQGDSGWTAQIIFDV